MKTSELSDVALDWAVCKAAEIPTQIQNGVLLWSGVNSVASPSLNWSQGGPIIESEFIHLNGSKRSNGEIYWFALRVKDDKSGCNKGSGPTPLVAAMRCFVESRMGDEVEVPEELRSQA